MFQVFLFLINKEGEIISHFIRLEIAFTSAAPYLNFPEKLCALNIKILEEELLIFRLLCVSENSSVNFMRIAIEYIFY